MFRTTVAWIALSLVAMATGCKMCASPYDYSSPTFTGRYGEDCAPHVRAGSILSGYFPPIRGQDFLPDQIPDLPGDPTASGIVMSWGGEQADDALLAEAAVIEQCELSSYDAPASEQCKVASHEAPATEKEKPPKSQGWVAVKRAETD